MKLLPLRFDKSEWSDRTMRPYYLILALRE